MGHNNKNECHICTADIDEVFAVSLLKQDYVLRVCQHVKMCCRFVEKEKVFLMEVLIPCI